jgi:putative (di)nucleoside polyphosphate hydrolase
MKFRKNVALILTHPGGGIFICERAGTPGSWQFPQGGCKHRESPEAALAREVREEVGLEPSAYDVLCSRGPYRYLFPPGFRKAGFGGQEQIYFLARLREGGDAGIRVDGREFRAFRWIAPASFSLDWLPPFKREVYRAVFRDFFGILLE